MNRNIILLAMLFTASAMFISCDRNDDDDNRITDIWLEGVASMPIGSGGELFIRVNPEHASLPDFEWTSSNPDVIQIPNPHGTTVWLTAKAEGEAVITATSSNGRHTTSTTVSAHTVDAQRIELNHHSMILPIGNTLQLIATIYPEVTTNQTVEWETTDASVATVEDGLVTAVGVGEAAIFATTACGVSTQFWVMGTYRYMTMTADITSGTFNIGMIGRAGISIDWGDGTMESFHVGTPITYTEFSHQYSWMGSNSERTITIAIETPYWVEWGMGVRGLSVSRSNITSIDVSSNPALEELWVGRNNLTTLDVSNNRALAVLYVDENQLTTLDVSRNVNLARLTASRNQLASLNLDYNDALVSLDVSRNQLTTLTVIFNNRSTGWLDVSNNQLTSLVLGEGHIATLLVSNNQLTELDLTGVRLHDRAYLQNNLFEAPALNAIFRHLPFISLDPQFPNLPLPVIRIGGNPGTDDADTSIATRQRWNVITSN